MQIKQSLLNGPQQLLRRNGLTLLAFAIPAAILLVAYMTRGVWPVLNRNILTIDLYHQYAPFLGELQSKLSNGGSLLYSWAGGLGTNFWALSAYYLASPLNILLLLFPASYLTEAILLLTIIKVGLSGAFFFLFLRGTWKQENYFMVAVSMLYALSSYSLAYSWDIMWLDGVFILPLMMLGIVKLVRDKSWLLYCLSLAYILYSNYYIAYFIVIFTILYFPIVLFQFQRLTKPKPFFGAVGRFVGFSLLGGGLASIMLIPTYFSLRLTSAADDIFPKIVTHSNDLADYINQHFMLVSPTIRDGMPNLYCGVFVLILIPLYFFAKSISLQQKLMNLALTLIMILSFNINILNFIWHGFHFPNQLPFRNSFVFIFLILTMVYPALQSLAEFTGKQIGAFCAAAVAVVILAQKLYDKPPELLTLYVTLVFIVIYAAVLTLDRIKNISRADLALAVLVVVITEMLLSTLLTIHKIDTTEYYSDRNNYTAGVEVDQIRTELANIAKVEKDNFYRVECIPPKTINDGFLYGYRGLSIFASTMSTKPVKTFENLGFNSNSINSYKYVNSTIVLDSLFGIKYLIRRAGIINDGFRESYVKTSELEIFANDYALPIGYVGQPELANWTSAGIDPFAAQNSLLQGLTGANDVFVPLSSEVGLSDNMSLTNSKQYFSYNRSDMAMESSARVNIIVEKDQQVYLYFQTTANRADRGYVMVGDERVDFDAKRSTLIDVGYITAGTAVELNIFYKPDSSQTGNFELFSMGLDKAVFEQSISQLREQSLQMTKFTDTQIEGTVTAKSDGIFMLSIPFDTGWSVMVDGVPTPITAIDDCFISFAITQGTHDIKMNYMPPWFMVGFLVSLGSLLILLLIIFVPKIFAKRKSRPFVRVVTVPQADQTDEPVQSEDSSEDSVV